MYKRDLLKWLNVYGPANPTMAAYEMGVQESSNFSIQEDVSPGLQYMPESWKKMYPILLKGQIC